MEELYKQIENALKTIVEIKWIDADTGQTYINPAPIVYPAALISVDEDITFDNISTKKQKAQSAAIIKLVFKNIEKTNALVPINFKDLYFARLRLIKKVSDIISTIKNTQRNQLRKKTYNGLTVYEIYFSANFID